MLYIKNKRITKQTIVVLAVESISPLCTEAFKCYQDHLPGSEEHCQILNILLKKSHVP